MAENVNKNVNKNELAKAVAAKAEITHKAAKAVIEATFEAIQAALEDGKTVQLIGFGSFEVRHRAARKGRNPQTGKTIEIPATDVPAFKPGKALKEAVN